MVPDPQSPEKLPAAAQPTTGSAPPADSTGAVSPPFSRLAPKPRNSATDPDQTLEEDVILGEFRLLRRLGRGGMSEVYLAEQSVLKRHVAIKVMRPELMLDESLCQRFQKEAQAVAGFNHPNIVQVYTVGEDNGRHYIVQEYINGQNLREYMLRKGSPALPLTVSIMRQVSSALQAAGQAGIVHRDIKPENIMLARTGEVKVADFGLAKRSEQPDAEQLTQVGTTMGTPLYMSPEQLSGNDVDHRSDLYSFGVTCYHMLAGQPPFRGDTPIAIAVQHLKAVPKSLEKLRPDLPPLLCRIVHKLLEKNPDTRYQTAAAILKDLKRVTEDKAHGGRDSGKRTRPGNDHPSDDRPGDDRPVKGRSRTADKSPTPPVGRHVGRYFLQLVDLPLRRQVPRLAAACLAIGLLGAGAGWLTRPVNPLIAAAQRSANRPQVNPIPARESARDQWFLARNRSTDPAAWEEVIRRFPDDKVYTPLAMMELGLLYIADNRLHDARRYFDQLVAYGGLNAEWQTAGWLGQALILHQEQDYAQSQQLLTDKADDLRQHLPVRLREYALKTVESNAAHLQQSVDARLQKVFEEQP